jgi:hypothetical protein
MQITVFLDMGDAIATSSDRHGVIPVEVELDKLSLVQRQTLANLRPPCPASGARWAPGSCGRYGPGPATENVSGAAATA